MSPGSARVVGAGIQSRRARTSRVRRERIGTNAQVKGPVVVSDCESMYGYEVAGSVRNGSRADLGMSLPANQPGSPGVPRLRACREPPGRAGSVGETPANPVS
ncbi:hypothetical protein GCM10010385_58380 [Streptomyces geysiriensis]|nr:hypothetical protein GCM10010385_58380 [Streptomyces geysiriensis]